MAAVHVGGIETVLGTAAAAAVAARGHRLVGPAEAPDVVIDCATAGAAQTGAAALGRGAELLAAAEAGGGRYVLVSSVLVYGDAGEEAIEAAEPVLDPPAGLEGLLDAELAMFASGARFLLLRAGVVPTAETLPTGAGWLPLLHPADLGAWLGIAVDHDLHGVYDAVSDLVRADPGRSRRVSGAQLAGVTGVAGRAWPWPPVYEASAS